MESLKDPERRKHYKGALSKDPYGRGDVPKHAHGTANLDRAGSSSRLIADAVLALYGRIADPALLVRRLTLAANHVAPAGSGAGSPVCEQLDLFSDAGAEERKRAEEDAALARERRMQEAMLHIKKKYGKNAILKGSDLEEGATAVERNNQIGGHRA